MVAIKSLAAVFTYVIGLCGMIPIFPWLTTFPRIILVAGLVVGLWQDRRGIWPLKPWMQNVLIVPLFLYYALQFSRANPVEPVTSFLAVMLAVRLGGEKTVRHSLQIYALSMFCLASSSLFDLSPVFLLYLGLLLFMVALALVLLTFQNQDQAMTVTPPDLKKILFSGLLMPLLALPLLVLLFPVIPRTKLPLWNFLNPPATRTAGYSDSVEPGSQSSVVGSRTLAFRAEMPDVAQSQLYWRGTVFNRTDGVRWTRSSPVPPEQPVTGGKVVAQVIYPEPSATHTLFALDRPVTIALYRVKRSPDGVTEIIGATGVRLSYKVDSFSGGVVRQRNPPDRAFYLQLPGQLPERVKALASQVVKNGKNDRARVDYLERFFRDGGYRYSTKDLATGSGAVEQFLFETKRGHCEFFASSFALLLRASGVPCRLVGGYLGGEYSPLGGYYLVTDDRAHVWVEAYIDGVGWERIDPSAFAANSGDILRKAESGSLIHRIRLTLDALNHSWNRSVITYDFEQQMKVVSQVGSRLHGIDPSRLLRSLAPYLAAILLLAGLLLLARRFSFFRSREQRIMQRFLDRLEHEFGIPARTGEAGLFEMASVADSRDVDDFVAIYAGAVYRDRRLTNDEYRRLKQIIGGIKGVRTKIS